MCCLKFRDSLLLSMLNELAKTFTESLENCLSVALIMYSETCLLMLSLFIFPPMI